MSEGPEKSFFQEIPPKFAFAFGIVSATALFSVLALVIILSKGISLPAGVNNESTGSVLGARDTTTAPTPTDPAPSPSAPSAPSLPSGTISPDSLSNLRGSGKITIVEYSDFECPFCKQFHSTLQQVMTDFDGKVQWALKHLPLESLHSKALREAMASECAAKQDKFWEYADLIFSKTPSNDGLPDEELFTIADEVGLNRQAFDACLTKEETKSKVQADAAEAQQLGGTGTPYSLIIDEKGKILNVIPGAYPYAQVSSVIQKSL
jgi:protein-disulfide isomerase